MTPLMTTDTERLGVVRAMLRAVQKLRSNSVEAHFGFDTPVTAGDDDPLLVDLQPWVFGSKSVLPLLDRIVTRGRVSGEELYNLLVIAHRLQPSIALQATLLGSDLPEPTLDLARNALEVGE